MSDYSDLTNLVDTLKNVYGEGLRNQFTDEKTLYNLFGKSDRKPAGLGYTFGIRYARAQGTGGRAESAPLPDPLTGKFDNGRINSRYVYGSLRLTGPMTAAAKGNVAAFVDGLADQMDDIYQSMVVDLNRQCQSDGFGLLATTSAAFTPSASTTWACTCDNDVGVMYCIEGQIVDFYNGTAADQSCFSQRISAVYPATKVLIFETLTSSHLTTHPITVARTYTPAAESVASGSYLVKQGARAAAHAATNTQYEIVGLDGIFDDGTLLATFENITVATYPKWQAQVISNSSVNRELSIDLMLNAVDMGRLRGGAKAEEIYMGLGQRRKYANLLLPDVRFAPGTLRGGYEVLTFSAGDGTVQMIIEPIAQPNKMYLGPKGVIQKYELAPLDWGNLDGSNLHLRSGYDEYDLFLRIYTNLGIEQRNCLTLLKDLVEPETY